MPLDDTKALIQHYSMTLDDIFAELVNKLPDPRLPLMLCATRAGTPYHAIKDTVSVDEDKCIVLVELVTAPPQPERCAVAVAPYKSKGSI